MGTASDERLADFRRVFAGMVVARAGCDDPAIRAAFETVPRHAFLGPGPWFVTEHGDATPSDDPALTYQDVAMGLAPERGITTGLPSLHARCIHACAPRRGERVLHVGAGAGYFTAILADLIGDAGSVVAFEIDAPLAARAQALLSARGNVRVVAGSGVTAEAGTVDLIYVCAGLQQIPLGWLHALAPGGRIALPLTPGDGEGGLLLLQRVDDRACSARFLCPARFVPCIGALDPAAGERLAAAFRAGSAPQVRSLRLGAPGDGQPAWFAGDGWWLSTEPA